MSLPPMEVAARLPRLREAVFAECDALLVTHLPNVRYLTGFTGSAGMLLVRAGDALLVTDGRYAGQSADQLEAAGVVAEIAIGPPARQREVIRSAVSSPERLGLEADHVSWGQQLSFAADGFELVPVSGAVEELRRAKDEGELARMAEAARIADDALASVRATLVDLPTEQEFALELDFAMRRLGAADVSFETIVASGPNGAKPHARPSGRRIEAGELVVIDFGALVDGYHSDMTRTVSVGPPKSPLFERMVATVAEAQAAGVEMVRAGASAADVDGACRSVIAEAGWADAFVHGTGHGVGLDIHEFPMINATATATLDAGYVVTVEPGVYLPGEDGGGVRIEDSVVVTAGGYRRLTNAPKDLVIS